jgi:hypothetical protein
VIADERRRPVGEHGDQPTCPDVLPDGVERYPRVLGERRRDDQFARSFEPPIALLTVSA